LEKPRNWGLDPRNDYGVLELSRNKQNFKIHSDSNKEPRPNYKTLQNQKSR
jgi:hypothetical protein